MILIDANIFMYAAGRPSPQQEPCQQFLRRLGEDLDRSAFCTNAEVLQEILHRYHALKIPEVGFRLVDAVGDLGIAILPVSDSDVFRARRLMAAHPRLSARDAVHAGVMQGRGWHRVLSYDTGFAALSWVERLEPSGRGNPEPGG